MPVNDVTRLWDMVNRHDKDLYHGNGKPAITVRLSDVEGDVSDLKTCTTNMEKKQDRILWLVVTTLVTLVTLLITTLVRGH